MAGNFKQNTIDLRKRMNQLYSLGSASKKDINFFVKKSGYRGKNFLINSDKFISQRGDFTTAFTSTDGEYAIDRYFQQHDSAAEVTHDDGNTSPTKGNTLKLEATADDASSYLEIVQILDGYQRFQGRMMTYTAEVRSNRSSSLRISDGVTSQYSEKHPGDGEWHTLSLTFNISGSSSELWVTVSSGSVGALVDGEYIELGRDKLEEGENFTGFEIADPAEELAKCQRYYIRYTPEGTATHLVFASGMVYASSTAQGSLKFPTMRDAPTISTSSTVTDFAVKHSGSLSQISLSSPTIQHVTTSSATLVFNTTSVLTPGDACLLGLGNAANAWIALDAELT